MTQQEFVELVGLVEQAARARKEANIPRQHIEEALRLINTGLEEVSRYPTGAPSLKGVYDIAVKLENLVATKELN